MLFISWRQSDYELRQSGHFVDLFLDGDTRAEVVKLNGARRFGKDGEGERIPFCEDLSVVDGVAVLDAETRTVNHMVAFLFAVLFVNDDEQTRAVHGNTGAAAAFYVPQVDELHHAVILGFKSRTLADAGCRTTDVEGAHGQLRAGLADGLRGDNADRFSEFDHAARCEVAAITQGANSAAGFTGEHGTNANALDTSFLDIVGKLFSDFLVYVDDHIAFEVADFFERYAADHAVTQRLDFHAGFDDGFDVDAVRSAAIELVDDDVLRHIDQTAGEVARIGRLQRRIRRTRTA